MHQADAVQRDSVFQEFAAATVEQLRGIVVARVRDVARTNGLAHLPDVYLVLQIWSAWTDVAEVQQWFQRAMENNEVRLLVESVQVGTSYTHGERVTSRTVSVNPKTFEPYLLPPMDLEQLSARLREIAASRDLGAAETEAMQEFERGMDIIRNGRQPDDPFAPNGS